MTYKERIASQCICCFSTNLSKSPAILMPFLSDRVFGWAPVIIDESWNLTTVHSGHAYSICNSLYCNDCHLLFMDIRFSESELNLLYDGYRGFNYANLREKYEPGYLLRNSSLNNGITYIDKIENFLNPLLKSPISILDWGGDTGKNTPFNYNHNTIDIFDISNKKTVSGTKSISRSDLSSNYNLIVCSNVLEHVPFPHDLLLDIKNHMNQSTILYIEVPFEDLIREHKFNSHFHKKHWHEHINFFSEKSLLSLLNIIGFKLLDLNILTINNNNKVSYLFQIACIKF
jgi:hypothetical protein